MKKMFPRSMVGVNWEMSMLRTFLAVTRRRLDRFLLCYTDSVVAGFGESLAEVVLHLIYETPAPGWRSDEEKNGIQVVCWELIVFDDRR